MLLHHEAIVASASGLGLSILAWGTLGVNAAVFYARRYINWRKKMPCYSRQTSTIEFGEQTDRAIFQRAVTEMGYTVNVNRDGTIAFWTSDGDISAALDMKGKLQVTTAEGVFDVNTIKRAYSTEVVKAAAKRFGWQVKSPAANKFEVQRRF